MRRNIKQEKVIDAVYEEVNRPKKAYWIEFLQGFLAIAVYFLGTSSNILDILSIDVSNWSDSAIVLFSMGWEILLLVIIIAISFKEIKKQFLEYKSNMKGYLKGYIKYWFIALGLMYLSNILILTFFTQEIAENEAAVRTLLDAFPLYIFITSVILAPLIEELIFRFSIRKLCFHLDWLFIFLSGFIFGLMHVIGATSLTGFVYIIPYSIPGWVFAYTLVKSNNIFVPISLHTIHNGILISLQLLFLTIL